MRSGAQSSSVVPARGQVDEGEDVVLDEAGEAQEDGVEQETHETQTFVQRPPVEVNSQDLDGQTGETGETGETQQRLEA